MIPCEVELLHGSGLHGITRMAELLCIRHFTSHRVASSGTDVGLTDHQGYIFIYEWVS